ncbi:hypothetical protein POSPLADRAFT_1039388 [Postia placenta MAD-698-R-SB12]|uniref:NAD(P)-binding domain-containing protein n=1 Tax=Postia placenta MAD-698-R-SB12 TaxID=670580 RepID=A0A1X6N6Z2_9APHY|nr:hypothetical protein POSPLADRAFT_1039388 [Postia placenta MAD-698-R-SB12]OSX64387.1 hypothetical protein POSPLADRAFT_1039388 [Postia placenta MAD-698-R-SB12]
MTGKSALIVGATGATGRHILRALLASTVFTRVGEFGRKVTPEDQIAEHKASGKLVQKVIDFERVAEEGLGEGKWDVVFITLGTTRKAAGSAEIYVVNAARATKTQDLAHKQRVVYLSSAGADASSHFLYTRSKGLTEQGLASIGFDDVVIFRPSFLAEANREQPKPGEAFIGRAVGLLSVVAPNVQIPVPTLAQSMYKAGEVGSAALPTGIKTEQVRFKDASGKELSYTVIDTAAAVKLAGHA